MTPTPPAHQTIVVARKPLTGTVAAAVLEYGTGALNIDGCRVDSGPVTTRLTNNGSPFAATASGAVKVNAGRWPANTLLTHSYNCDDDVCVDSCPVAVLDTQSGFSKSSAAVRNSSVSIGNGTTYNGGAAVVTGGHADSGGASRYFNVTRWDESDLLADEAVARTVTSMTLTPEAAPATPDLTFPHGTVLIGSCLDRLRDLPDNSVDAVVTDPPYGMTELPADKVAQVLVQWLTTDRAAMPTGKGFMGKSWDAFVPPPALWDECLRVLKPGGHVLAFASARTIDLMTLSVRLAGFEVRDTLHWTYGSGFPKSLDVSKAIDKQRDDSAPAAAVAKWLVDQMAERDITRNDICEHFGASNIAQQWTTHWTDGAVKPRVPRWEQWLELRRWLDLPGDMDAEVWRLNGRKGTPGEAWDQREVIGSKTVNGPEGTAGGYADGIASLRGQSGGTREVDVTAPATPEAQQWAGWGTALKPSHEPIVVARKPLTSTVAGTVLEYGTGALNIDGCRVGTEGGTTKAAATPRSAAANAYGAGLNGSGGVPINAGRWPANTLLTHAVDCADVCVPVCPVAALDEQSGTSKSQGAGTRCSNRDEEGACLGHSNGGRSTENPTFHGPNKEGTPDAGGASRFFPVTTWDPTVDDVAPFWYAAKPGKRERNAGLDHLEKGNGHPTVKPQSVLAWLIRLVTPPGGVVLDPFLGSGTTAVAAVREGFQFIGCEITVDYLPILSGRIAHAEAQAAAVEAAVDVVPVPKRVKFSTAQEDQLPLFS